MVVQLKRDEGDRRRRSPRNDASSMYRAYPCAPGGQFNYAWDDPSVSPNAIRFLLDEPDPPHHDVDILAIGTSNPLTSSVRALRVIFISKC